MTFTNTMLSKKKQTYTYTDDYKKVKTVENQPMGLEIRNVKALGKRDWAVVVKKQEVNFWGSSNILFLDLGRGSMVLTLEKFTNL